MNILFKMAEIVILAVLDHIFESFGYIFDPLSPEISGMGYLYHLKLPIEVV